MDLFSEYNNIISMVQELLNNNVNEWTSNYKRYSDLIMENQSFIKDARKNFHQWEPLYVYSNISDTINANKSTVKYSLRFEGQKVATLNIKNNGNVSLKENNSIYKNFEYIKTDDTEYDWNSEKAKKFRNYFKKRFEDNQQRIDNGKSNLEHRLESLLLTEFSKSESKNKAILNIQPVTLLDSRFQMPTPFSASKAKDNIVEYSGKNGGGIDILTRMRKGNRARICIMELKDECISRERPEKAIKQAIAYATFIRELLRHEEANNECWWKLFGFSFPIPKDLILNAVIVMPIGDYNDKSFEKKRLSLGGNDQLELHYIYFDENTVNNDIIKIKPIMETSLN
ncbi:hypothetical protein [Sedimentibacter sp. MB31-C6]|uniref:hypothetical protein n=1 Tax=Sedimentibacter sp. MB31-C6 TaxID=3109366 RepID=UPI002DDD6DE8|nr:hypothetical protein [Sedimentibacter sp. MB36-C1]WSI04809.1 hypothetical protein U8307_03210 [Sedimentibacter sp. MB36-C1]